MRTFERDCKRILRLLHRLNPKDAEHFAVRLSLLSSGLEIAGFAFEDFNLRRHPLKVRQEALEARVVLEQLRNACRSVELEAESLLGSSTESKKGNAPPKASPPAPSIDPQAAAKASPAPRSSSALARRPRVIDAELVEDKGRRSRRSGARAPEQLELCAAAIAPLALPRGDGEAGHHG